MSEEVNNTPTEAVAFTGADGEVLTGKDGQNAFLGYQKLPDYAAEPEEKTYEGHNSVEDAANV